MFFLFILVVSIICGIPSEANNIDMKLRQPNNHIMDQHDLIGEHKEGMEKIQVEVNAVFKDDEKHTLTNDEIKDSCDVMPQNI